MTVGTIQTLVVCVPGTHTQSPCPTGMVLSTMQAYVLDSSQQSTWEAVTGPFDYSYAAGLWSLAFTMVVGLFLVSRSAGTILEFIRRG